MDIAGIVSLSGRMYVHATILGERKLPRSSMIIDAAAHLNYADKPIPPAVFICGGKDNPHRCTHSRVKIVNSQDGLQTEGIGDFLRIC